MRNLFAEFKALIPQPPLQVGEVTAVANNIATVELPSGDTVQVRGAATVGQQVFFRDGVIEGIAPGLPVELIDI